MKTTKIEHDNLWLLAGVVEELRNRGVSIPVEADAIVSEALINVNIPRYMAEVFTKRNLPRLKSCLEALEIPDDLPEVYGAPDKAYFAATSRLAPFTAQGFLEDRVLGVGLKSYPYVLDFDGDGRKDLLVGDHDGFIYVYRNQGTDANPVFGHAERLRAVDTGEPLLVRLNPKMSFGDLTGSGSLDLVLGNYGGEIPFVPNRAPAGAFAFAIEDVRTLRTRSGPIDVGNYAYPELVDWEGNGTLDLIVGNVEGEVTLFKNLGRPGEIIFDTPQKISGLRRLMYPYPIIVDWDGDGRKDLTLGHRDGTIMIYLNVGTNADPRFEYSDVARHSDGRPVHVGLLSHHFIVDWNNDGKKDLVVGNDPGQVIVFLNVGTNEQPIFDEGHMLDDGGGELIMGAHPVFTMVDFNGDGRRDLLVGHEEERLRLFMNTGTSEKAAFETFTHVNGIVMSRDCLTQDDEETGRFWDLRGLEFNREYLGNCAPCAVDWHNSGKLDLLVGHYTGLVYFFENIGSPSELRFSGGVPLRMGDSLLRVAGYSTPVVCDWNNDGKKDLVVGDLLGRVHVFINNGTDAKPEFNHDAILSVKGEPIALGPRSIVEVADIDGDGRKDVLVGNRWGDVYALMNVGTDTQPVFDSIERVRDASDLWRRLYAGWQYCDSFRRKYESFPSSETPKPMNVVETSCPRVVDLAGKGRRQLLVSQRYGRLFLYDELSQVAD